MGLFLGFMDDCNNFIINNYILIYTINILSYIIYYIIILIEDIIYYIDY